METVSHVHTGDSTANKEGDGPYWCGLVATGISDKIKFEPGHDTVV